MRLYLAILVSLSFWIASEAESSRVHSERHWLEEAQPVVESPSAAGDGGGFTPAPTEADTASDTEDATGAGEDTGGDSGTEATPAPSSDQVPEGGTSETPSPTTTPQGATPAPSLPPGPETSAPTPFQEAAATPAPTSQQASETPEPTSTQETPAPTPLPWADTPAPTERPEAVYVSTDDDPLQPVSTGTEDSAAWTWKDSNVDDVEHDRTVIIALTVTFAVGVCLAIITAQQMLENPNGCCVSICRIFVAVTCGITRCVCYPCRAMCGCTNADRRNHDMMLRTDDDYTHDLELS